MNWLFRVASKKNFGSGHISRCAELARFIGKKNVKFLLDKDSDHWTKFFFDLGIDIIKQNEIHKYKFSAIIYDPYQGIFDELDFLSKFSKNIYVISDHLNIPNNISLFINYGTSNNFKTINNIPCLLGPKYALISSNYKKTSVPIRKSVANILISLGSYDSENVADKILKSLNHIKSEKNKLNIIIALSNESPHLQNIQTRIKSHSIHCEILKGSKSLWNILPNIDLSIGAGGLSLFERLAAGVPNISIATNKLQLESLKLAEKKGASIFLGYRKDLDKKNITNSVDLLLNNYEKRLEMSSSALKLVDGKGIERVGNLLLGNTNI